MLDATSLPRGSAVRCNIVAIDGIEQWKVKFHYTYLSM